MVINNYESKSRENHKLIGRINKIRWNNRHFTMTPDFYTVGYAGRNTRELLTLLQQNHVATLVDVRYFPISRYRPEFSKKNLSDFLITAGIEYVHRSDWGVPKDIRAFSFNTTDRDTIWKWYDEYILPKIIKRNMDDFFNTMTHPIALMCVEYDPTECHRHRISLGLEKIGLRGLDL